MTASNREQRAHQRRAIAEVLLYGAASGVLIAILKLTEYRFLVVEHSLEVYGVVIAALFAGLGIWLGANLRRRRTQAVQIGKAQGLLP